MTCHNGCAERIRAAQSKPDDEWVEGWCHDCIEASWELAEIMRSEEGLRVWEQELVEDE